MNELETAIGNIFVEENAELAKTFRDIKATGGSKDACIREIIRSTKGNQFMRNGLLIMLDRVWDELKKCPDRSHRYVCINRNRRKQTATYRCDYCGDQYELDEYEERL